MQALILGIHGFIRWVVGLVAVAAVVKFGVGWLGKQKVQPIDVQIGNVFAWATTTQFAIGVINLVLFILAGAFNPAKQIEHAFYGLIATALSHMGAAQLRKEGRSDEVRFRNAFIMSALALVLVFFSVVRLRGGWVW